MNHEADAPLDALDDMLETEAPPTKWPTAIGVICVVYAGLGLLCQAGAVVMLFLSETFMAMGGLDVEMPGFIKITGAASAVVTALVGLMLLVGGMQLLRRRRSGLAWIKRWVVARLLLIVVGIAANFVLAPANMQFQRSMLEAQNKMLVERDRPDLVKEFDEDKQWRNQIIGMAVSSAAFAAFPLFLGFYLARRKIADEVSQWP